MSARRTKRRYAHELYPHPGEYEVRPLAVDVPYLYARAIGLEVWGTSWFDLGRTDEGRTPEGHAQAIDRTLQLVAARELAFVADALLQGMTGDEAWEWAQVRHHEESGEIVADRAKHYGVDWDAIKPYPCGPEPGHHSHYSAPDAAGWKQVTRIDIPESECDDCTEPVDPTT